MFSTWLQYQNRCTDDNSCSYISHTHYTTTQHYTTVSCACLSLLNNQQLCLKHTHTHNITTTTYTLYVHLKSTLNTLNSPLCLLLSLFTVKHEYVADINESVLPACVVGVTGTFLVTFKTVKPVGTDTLLTSLTRVSVFTETRSAHVITLSTVHTNTRQSTVHSICANRTLILTPDNTQ